MASKSVISFLLIASAAFASGSFFDYESANPLLDASDYLADYYNYNSNPHARVTRGADKKMCCGDGTIQIEESDKEMAKKCMTENGIEMPPPGDHKHGPGGPGGPGGKDFKEHMKKKACACECMGKATNMIDDDGYTKTAFIDEVVTKAPAELKDFAKTVATDCVTNMNAKAKEIGKVEANGKQCNPAFGMTVLCTIANMETECPAAQQVKSDDCDKRRGFFKMIKEKVAKGEEM
uniref:Chemosensory protein n=1 Tax=Blattella germanica TaxID=6973 RepID=A0A109QL89_BLAGE|nr:chemosensory protein [Blattella germanica]